MIKQIFAWIKVYFPRFETGILKLGGTGVRVQQHVVSESRHDKDCVYYREGQLLDARPNEIALISYVTWVSNTMLVQ